MSAHAMFVSFTPKTVRLARRIPSLWGILRPLEPTEQLRSDIPLGGEATVLTESPMVVSRSIVAERDLSHSLRLVADANTTLAKSSAIYIDLDDYQ
jgi:hypothetical protein